MTTTEVGRRLVEENLSHHGVKGMHWGVRRQEVGSGGHIRISDKTGRATISRGIAASLILPSVACPPLAPAAIAAAYINPRARAEITAAGKHNKMVKADKKFEKHAHSPENFAAIHNGARERISRDLDSLNKKYSGHDLTKDPAAMARYNSEAVKKMQDAYRESANQLGNKTGTRHLDVEFHNDGLDFKIVAKEGMQTPTPERVTHAASDFNVEVTGKIKRAESGHIIGFEFDDLREKGMTQSAIGEQFVLSHFGVKGMHWGVRRAESVTTQTHIDTGLVKRKTKVVATGGHAHPAHEDAIKAEVQEQKLKKSGHAALSNKELRDLITRRQLEDQASAATSTKGRKFARKQLEIKGQQQVQKGLGGVGATASNQAWKAAAKVAFA